MGTHSPQSELVVYCYNALARGGRQLTINEGVLVDSIKNEEFTFLCTQPHVVDDTAHTSDLIALNWEGLRERERSMSPHVYAHVLAHA